MGRVWRWIPLSGIAAWLPGCFHFVAPNDPAIELPPPGAFPHHLLTEVLAAHVDPDGRIDYAAIQQDRATLDAYLGYVALTSPHSDPQLFPTRDDALAYWINAYNALAIQGVIDRPGLESVDDIKVEYFYLTRYQVGGRRLDLYRLENGVVRSEFDEPRIHFALNCQSMGCPQLPAEAFVPGRLQEQLAQWTRDFVTDPAKVRVEGGVVHLSQIFEWYASDFEPDGPLAFINANGGAVPAKAALSYIPYDWALIAQEGRGP
ncbi:MAG TPA: DUF547 domain-containing protein [Deltaproteobacteria bacterium]|nr:DUF547 domain-containing protein [Deltaproteobacteria bacterium]